MHRPVRFQPFLRPMVWGGRRLGDVLGKPLQSPHAYGESWELSDHSSHHSVAQTAPWAGQTLRQLMEATPDQLLGPAAASHRTFPWLIKFLDAHDWLSVQVHPDANAVRTLWPGEGSKTEAWFVLDAAPGSRIFAGLKPGVDAQVIRSALQTGSVADYLHSFTPRPGDCVFLPAGTVHAVGGGVLMAEIQQTSDATFRLFDWNRRDAQGNMRMLHVEEGLASIDWQQGPVHALRVDAFRRASANGVRSHCQELVRCPFFILEYAESREPLPWGVDERLQVAIVLEGNGRLATSDGEEPIGAGQVWLLPAAMPPVRCTPEPAVKVLFATLP